MKNSHFCPPARLGDPFPPEWAGARRPSVPPDLSRPSVRAFQLKRRGSRHSAAAPTLSPGQLFEILIFIECAKIFGLNFIVRRVLDNPTRDRPPECSIESLGGFHCAAAPTRHISFEVKAIARLMGNYFQPRVWLLCLLTLEFRRFPSCQHSQYLGLNLVYWNVRCLLNLAVVHRFDFQ